AQKQECAPRCTRENRIEVLGFCRRKGIDVMLALRELFPRGSRSKVARGGLDDLLVAPARIDPYRIEIRLRWWSLRLLHRREADAFARYDAPAPGPERRPERGHRA